MGVSEEEFQRSTMFHGQDQRKGMQIMQMQQQTNGMPAANKEMKVLSKDKVIETFRAQQDIQMESMDEMLKDGMGGAGDNSQEGQMMMMMKMMVQQSKASDKLWDKTGVEEDQLNFSIMELKLQEDPDFMKMVNENMAKVMAKA